MDEKMNDLDGVEIEFTRDDACAWPWPKVADPVFGHPFRANELVKKLFGDRERVTAVDVRTWLADVSSAKVDDIPFQTDFSDLRKHLNLRVDVSGTAAPRPIEERLKYIERQFLKNARFGATYGTTPASMLKWLEEKIGPEEAKKIQESLLASKHTGPVESKAPPAGGYWDYYDKEYPKLQAAQAARRKVYGAAERQRLDIIKRGNMEIAAKMIDSTPFVVAAMREELVTAMKTLPADKVRKLASFVEQLLKEV